MIDSAENLSGDSPETAMAVLGHDLRNPLHAALACTEMLQRKLTDPQLLMLTTRMRSDLRRMSALIDDVRDFSAAIRGDGLGVEMTDVLNVTSALTRVIQELEDAHPDCKIVSTLCADRPVHCDLGRLQQLASNLLANALTHGQPKVPVELTAYCEHEDLILQVWNAGESIPHENIEKIFEPFWRPATSARRTGLGLGLYICSQIVRAHDGSLAVESTAALGTLFTARLPLCPLPRQEQPSVRIPPERRCPDHRAGM
jgi:signal transduction histidine kinase